MDQPNWWDWELGFTAHTEARMEERSFSEVELRGMLEDATDLVPASRPGRWIVRTRLAGRRWTVVVEPDYAEQTLIVVTAYPQGDAL